MPRVRRRGKIRRWTIEEEHVEYLRTGFSFDGDTAFQGDQAEFLEDAWRQVSGLLMAEGPPGTRPWAWWHLDAPADPRRRLGGVGTPIPGCGLHRGKPAAFRGDHSDDDPPRYESEETYLRRHNLLTDEETEELAHTQGDK